MAYLYLPSLFASNIAWRFSFRQNSGSRSKMERNVKQKFDTYPKEAYAKLIQIRTAIYEVAAEDNIGAVTETLKWGEPSYLARGGSTVRMDWKPKFPDQVCLYFHCQTILVDTFKEIYRDILMFDGNRAIVLPLSDDLPIEALKHCISMSLRYHQIKHLPLLGA